MISKAKGANTGKSIAVVAKFDVISVKKFTAAINKRISKNRGKTLNEVISSPSHKAKPLVSNALASAIPPPKRIIIPHGKLIVSLQLSNAALFCFDGKMNNKRPKLIAMIVSSNDGKIFCKKNDLLIQHKPAKAKTIATNFSSKDIGPNSFFIVWISAFPPGKLLLSNLYATLVK